MRRGRMGHRVTHLRPASGGGLQGGFGMGRVEVPPHPPATRGSRVLQDRVWGSRVLQLFLWYRHGGSQGLLSWIRGVRGLQGGHGMGRAEVPPHPSAIRGSRVLQGPPFLSSHTSLPSPPFLSSHTSLPSPPLSSLLIHPCPPPPFPLFSYIPAPPPLLSSHTSLPSPPPSSLLIHPCPPPPFPLFSYIPALPPPFPLFSYIPALPPSTGLTAQAEAARDIEAGEIVTCDLTPAGAFLGDGALLLDYAQAYLARQVPTYELVLPVPEDCEFRDDKVDILETAELGEEMIFTLLAGQDPPQELLATLRLLGLKVSCCRSVPWGRGSVAGWGLWYRAARCAVGGMRSAPNKRETVGVRSRESVRRGATPPPPLGDCRVRFSGFRMDLACCTRHVRCPSGYGD